MSDNQPVSRSGWRDILELGENLLAQPTILSQREIILDTVTRLVPGQVELWLADSLCRLANAAGSLPIPPAPPSDLMQQALDERQNLTNADGTSAAVPMIAHGAPLGVLQIERPSGPPLDPSELELLEGLALQSAITLQAASQVAVERWRVEQLSLVRQVSAQVASLLDLSELSQRVTNLVLETFEYYYAALFVWDLDQESLICTASAGPLYPKHTHPITPPVQQVRSGLGMVGRAAQTGEEILARDVSHEPSYVHVDVLPETRSEVALPLKIKERVLGVLDVQSDQLDGFDETDLLVLRALADQIAIAIEDARLYGDLRRRADQLAGVAEVSRAVSSILNLDTLFENVVQLIHTQFEYPFVYLFTTDQARQEIILRAGTNPIDVVPQSHDMVCKLDDTQSIAAVAACHGTTVVVDDIDTDPQYHTSRFGPSESRSELAVPLMFGDNVLGVLDVQSKHRSAFSEQDRILFETLADNVAIAIRNANLYNSERWRRQVADSLREVAGLLSADAGLEEVLESILVELERNLPCEAAAIWLLRGEDLCLAAMHGFVTEVCINDLAPEAAPWLHQALHSAEAIIRTPDSPLGPLGSAMGFPQEYSAIATPLRVGERRLGVLSLAHSKPGRYGAESRSMTAAFASYAAVAIENTRLYQETQKQASISTVMLQVVQSTQMMTTLDDVLEAVVDLMPLMVGVDRCAILLWDEDKQRFVPSAAYGFSADQHQILDNWSIAPGDEPAFDDLRSSMAPLFIFDVATDARLVGPTPWALGFESMLLMPLLAQGKVLGAMLMDYQDDWLTLGTVDTLQDERLAIIQGITLQTASAIENTQLREAQREEAYVSAALLQVAQAVASLNELDTILGTIVRIMPLLVGVDRCAVFLWDEEYAVYRLTQAFGLSASIEQEADELTMGQDYTAEEFPLLSMARESGEHVPFSSLGEPQAKLPQEFARPSADTELEIQSLVAVPLSVKGDVLGVMLLEEAKELRRGSQDRWLEIVNGIAHQTALAIQSDMLQKEMAGRERLERELQLAREIQQTLMPRQVPDLPGWELAAICLPARQVGGDFYDFFELPGERLGLVIADVADKGMPAALFMALTRTLIRAAALEETSPAAALGRANDLLAPDAEQGMFVTAAYAVLCRTDNTLTYANAGHNLPLIYRANTGKLEALKKGGMALGVMEGTRAEEHSVTLEHGDAVVFFTDGVTEAFSVDNEIYGDQRLEEAIFEATQGSAQQVLETIHDSVVEFIGNTPASDDLTLMILRRSQQKTREP